MSERADSSAGGVVLLTAEMAQDLLNAGAWTGVTHSYHSYVPALRAIAEGRAVAVLPPDVPDCCGRR